MKKAIRTIGLILCLVICVTSLASCKGETLITFEDKSISKNTYEFMLSRMKGTLAYYGYDVEGSSFWKTVVASDGTTYDDYFCATILQETVHYAIADHLFDKEGLVFDKESEDAVDELMAAYVKKAGSRTALNSELKEFGINYGMLRDIYILEAKIHLLKEHLYGSEGEKIDRETREDFLNENYVAFKQIFIASYYYVTDLDRFGDTVYYTDEKHTAIAYDKQNGFTKTNEYGKPVKDVLGDPEYYNADGKIAYDTQNGVVGYVTDDNGNQVIADYDDAKKSEIYLKAADIAKKCDGDSALFEENASLYNESESDGLVYLYNSSGYYAAQNDSFAYFDEMAEKLSYMDIGECQIYESDYGYHILCRYENEEGAYEMDENKDAFASFDNALIDHLFSSLCSEYEALVDIDKDILDGAMRMKDVGTNTIY